MNLMGRADTPGAPPAGQPSALAGLAGQSHLLNWADKTFGQGLTSLTKGNASALHGHVLDLPFPARHSPSLRRGPNSLRHRVFHSPPELNGTTPWGPQMFAEQELQGITMSS